MSQGPRVSMVELGLKYMQECNRIEPWARRIDVEHEQLSDKKKEAIDKALELIYEAGSSVRIAALQAPDNATLTGGQARLDEIENLLRAVLQRNDVLNAQGRN
ncbi:hypothetical protein F5Y00DRAFT_266239 [Daldinia vernicosa]|uniref:uncharacterized protein n=1 Tax=Daldinia vernicosa TaxID=114800 RepID=UPI002008C57C|nr:uncharacterized protein F5Y00DRAFT_266239 [Daldinia vernicosa]KAI0844817.1 hypothetical protein F5Y00DRAFT_266239 [Daldinia vernicosa]